jgi:hypothetical protein
VIDPIRRVSLCDTSKDVSQSGAGLESVVVDEQGRSAVRFELQPGSDGHCGEDLAVEWHVKM